MSDNVIILAIETSSEACSAALLTFDLKDDEPKVITRNEPTPRQHAKVILSMLDELLEEGGVELKEVDAIGFSRGPGAFTGLRIAAGVAQGVALSVDKPVAPIPTLSAIALQAIDMVYTVDGDYRDDTIVVAMDARMGEIYWGFFRFEDDSRIVLLGDEKVTKPDVMFEKAFGLANAMPDNRVFCLGSGWDLYKDEVFKDGKPDSMIYLPNAQPNAAEIAELAMNTFLNDETVSPEDAQPIYIRNDVAKKSQKQS